ncbi:MAG: MBL fold metallo-hydrolase, partial [Firmicutes bacterium]|nr:MBL fold metallo-hydrolase [Bacillota bacterium]
MIEKIAENLYTTRVPLPDNPLRYINVYIIKGADEGDRTLVIDTGFNRPECENAIQEALDAL